MPYHKWNLVTDNTLKGHLSVAVFSVEYLQNIADTPTPSLSPSLYIASSSHFSRHHFTTAVFCCVVVAADITAAVTHTHN